MDIFKFRNPTDATQMEQGEIINNLKSKLWIERYEVAGEFKLVADISTGIKSTLPIGTFISHTDTQEVMVVEDHEINDSKSKRTEISITGRSFETVLDQRVVGAKKTLPKPTGGWEDFQVSPTTPWGQILTLINVHAGSTAGDDEIPHLYVTDEIDDTTPVLSYTRFKLGSLYNAVVEILRAYDLGIRVIRPGPWRPAGATVDQISLVTHQGVDRSSEVVFNHDTGEIETADYLWSNRNDKNTALVHGMWVGALVTTGPVGIERRVLHVDASNLDNKYASPGPTGAELTTIIAEMQQRGLEALNLYNKTAITHAEVSKEGTRAKYREDYYLGDTVAVIGEYNESAVTRIKEHVEIEDETGLHAYPTFTG